MSRAIRAVLAIGILAALAGHAAAATKDQARIAPEAAAATASQPAAGQVPGSDSTAQSGSGAPAAGSNGGGAPAAGAGSGGASPGTEDSPAGGDQVLPDLSPDATGDQSGGAGGDLSLGEIPDITSIELTTDMAKRAIDTYSLVKTKYANTDMEQYDNLQDFVDQNPQGKAFEADVKAAGFANVNDWNQAITTLGFAYSAATNDPTADIKQQISEIQADQKIAQDMKDRMIKSLNAMVPSDNNRKVVAELLKDAAYAEKLKQLDTEEE